MTGRLDALRGRLAQHGLDAILISQPENRRYLSGFTGSAGYLLLTDRKSVLATDFRYVEQATAQAPAFEVHRIQGKISEWLPPLLTYLSMNSLGFEAEHLTFAVYQEVVQGAKENNIKVAATSGLVEELRMVKDAEELAKLRRAIGLADAAFTHALSVMTPQMTEKALAWQIERHLREGGAEGVSFDIIVAAGPNAALPHAQPTQEPLGQGRPIVMDLGARLEGYCSDLTRTVCLGTPDDIFRRSYDIVLGAQLTAIATMTTGITGEQADTLARNVITQAGYGQAFGHGLGHGVGLAVHEEPRLGPTSSQVLKNGMVFSVEPGIYLPGWGGIRIEDLVLLEDGHAQVLSHAPKIDAVERTT